MLIRLVANAAAFIVAAFLVPGIHLGDKGDTTGMIVTALLVAFVFGVVNTLVKPVVALLSLPFVVLTLGLFLLVVNMLMFMLTSAIAQAFALGFRVDGWIAALLGSIVVSIVSALVSGVLGARK